MLYGFSSSFIQPLTHKIFSLAFSEQQSSQLRYTESGRIAFKEGEEHNSWGLAPIPANLLVSVVAYPIFCAGFFLSSASSLVKFTWSVWNQSQAEDAMKIANGNMNNPDYIANEKNRSATQLARLTKLYLKALNHMHKVCEKEANKLEKQREKASTNQKLYILDQKKKFEEFSKELPNPQERNQLFNKIYTISIFNAQIDLNRNYKESFFQSSVGKRLRKPMSDLTKAFFDAHNCQILSMQENKLLSAKELSIIKSQIATRLAKNELIYNLKLMIPFIGLLWAKNWGRESQITDRSILDDNKSDGITLYDKYNQLLSNFNSMINITATLHFTSEKSWPGDFYDQLIEWGTGHESFDE